MVCVPKLMAIQSCQEHIMEVIVKKWGNSAAVRIPASVMAAAHVELEQSVHVREEQGRIVIEPVRRKAFKLNDLLGGITTKNQHKPVDTGAPVGKEVW
jgi:antitoxin MazE